MIYIFFNSVRCGKSKKPPLIVGNCLFSVSCQTLGYPDGSNISISSINSVTVATISCSTGYTLNGAKSLTCRSDGSWDFILPTCGMVLFLCFAFLMIKSLDHNLPIYHTVTTLIPLRKVFLKRIWGLRK